MQYVVLRNIAFIVQKYPALFVSQIKVFLDRLITTRSQERFVYNARLFQMFFCKYNDPPYVKLEKLEILVALATEATIDQVVITR